MGPQTEKDPSDPGRTHVPQAGPPATRLHDSDKKRDREKATDHMRKKDAKRDIKL
jgi:hypothetical protein